jgi:hypothetical protein
MKRTLNFLLPWRTGGVRPHDAIHALVTAVALIAFALTSFAGGVSTGEHIQKHHDAQWIATHHYVDPHFKAPAGTKLLPLLSEAPEETSASINLVPWKVGGNWQGIVGACMSWAVDKSAAYSYNSQTGAHVFFSPRLYYDGVTHGQDVGSDSVDYPAVYARYGLVRASAFPYGPKVGRVPGLTPYHLPAFADDASIPPEAYAHAITGWTLTVDELWVQQGSGEGGVERIEQAIAAGHPVVVGIPVYPQFDAAIYGNSYIGLPGPKDVSRGNHAINLIAYFTDPNGGVWFLVSTPWGKGWGGLNEHGQPTQWAGGGYAWISGEFIAQYAFEAAVVQLVKTGGN